VSIAAGSNHSIALDNTGIIHVWGDNSSGQLGNGTTTNSLIPIQQTLTIRSPSITNRFLSKGYGYHKVIRPALEQGYNYIAVGGDSTYGQCGDNTTNYRYSPAPYNSFPVNTTVVAAANSMYHSAVVLNNGMVYTWGRNIYYECGISSGLNIGVPTQVGALSSYNAQDVACGTGITLVLMTNGTVASMGTNFTGMLGNGSALNTSTSVSGPIIIPTLTNITAIAAGENHACAIDNNGYLWVWGANTYGQFGLGNTINLLTPAQVPFSMTAGSTVKDVSCGYGHTLIITGNNQCMSAGLNSLGQLGYSNNAGTPNSNVNFTQVQFYTQVAYPLAFMTGSTTTITGFPVGNGTYISSASTGNSYQAFGYGASSPNTWFWETTGFSPSSFTTNFYDLSNNIIAYTGEWLQIQLPNPISMIQYTYSGRLNYWQRSPYNYVIVGSTDGITWYLVDDRRINPVTYSATVTQQTLSANVRITPYNYFRMIVNTIQNSSNGNYLDVCQWILYTNAIYPYTAYPVKVACGQLHSVVLMANGTIRCFGNNDRAQLGMPSCTTQNLLPNPPVALTSASFAVSGQIYGNGTYTITASTTSSGTVYYPFQCAAISGNYWGSSVLYNTSVPYNYTGSQTTTVSGNVYLGEWIQIQVPIAIVVTKFNLIPNAGNQGPGIFYLAGSTNGTTWTLLGSFAGNTSGYYTKGANTYYPIPTSNSYSYFRIIINNLTGSAGLIAINNITLFTGGAYSYLSIKPYKYRNIYYISAGVNTTYVEALLPRETGVQSGGGSPFTKVRSYGFYEWGSGDMIAMQNGPAQCENFGFVDKTGQIGLSGNSSSGQCGGPWSPGGYGGASGRTSGTQPIAFPTNNYGSLGTYNSIGLGGSFASISNIVFDTIGRVHSTGHGNSYGTIGNGTTGSQYNNHILISGLYGSLTNNIIIIAIACGNRHVLALDSLGRVHAWGCNANGQLGNNTQADSYIPILITGFGSLTGNVFIVSIACGYYHSMALDSFGHLHVWGINNQYQLGNGNAWSGSVLVPILAYPSPYLTNYTYGVAISATGNAGNDNSYFIDSNGKIYATGYGQNNNSLGNGAGQLSTFTLISNNGSLRYGVFLVFVSCGYQTTMTIDSSGQIHTWGSGGNYVNTTSSTYYTPYLLGYNNISSRRTSVITCFYYSTILFDSNGLPIVTGYNNLGELGMDNYSTYTTWTLMTNVYGYGSIFCNFTGQHRCFIENFNSKQFMNIEGLIVCANKNKYITTNGWGGDANFLTGMDAITTNDSLPLVSLSSKAKDKTVFGIVSLTTNYDPGTDPTKEQIMRQLELGDQRAEINSVGEGGIWICDANGSIESGDYITTSVVPGYGQKQDEPYICNYTVAKITMDCDFIAPLEAQVTIQKDQFNNNVIDMHGMPVYVPYLDSDNNPIMRPSYKTRYLNPDGTEITKAAYDASIIQKELVYKAAFVGCTYHCG
jgi:alpha-tubulin suppressor-like RCC1 family protein